MSILKPKRCIALTLTIAVLAWLCMQTLVVLNLKQELRQIKWAMKSKVIQGQYSDNLQTFSFTALDWQSLAKPDPTEFIYQGHYYDIAFVIQNRSGVMVKCLKDELETDMKNTLLAWMGEEDSPFSKSKQKGNVYNVLSKVMLPLISEEVLMISEVRKVYFFKALDYSFIFSIVPLRPPIG